MTSRLRRAEEERRTYMDNPALERIALKSPFILLSIFLLSLELTNPVACYAERELSDLAVLARKEIVETREEVERLKRERARLSKLNDGRADDGHKRGQDFAELRLQVAELALPHLDELTS